MMPLITSDVLQEDVDDLVDSHLDLWMDFQGSRILLTGASGFVGSFIARFFADLYRRHGIRTDLLLVVRDEGHLWHRLDGSLADFPVTLIQQDLCDPLPIKIGKIDYCIHAASNANPVVYQRDPLGTMMTNVLGTYNVINRLAAQVEGPVRTVYLSSVEAYGSHEGAGVLKEGTLGVINPALLRNCYPLSKLAAENLCVGARSMYGLHISVARLAYLYGPGDDIDDPKVVTSFLRDLAQGRDIELHSPGAQKRTYCYIKDAVFGILLLLLRGKDQTYNISDMDDVVSIADIAQILADLFARSGQGVVRKKPDWEEAARFPPAEDNILDNAKITGLGFSPTVGMQRGLERTGAFFGLTCPVKVHTEPRLNGDCNE